MMRKIICLASLFALVVLPTANAQSKEDVKVDPAEWVPADALVYFGVTDMAETWKDYQQTAGYKLMKDKAVAEAIPAMGMVGSAMEKLEERLAKALDVSTEQLKNPFGGPLAFYLDLPAGGKAKDLEPGLIASIADGPLMKKYYDSAVTKLKDSMKHKTESAGAATIDVFTRDESAEKGGSNKGAGEDDFGEMDEGPSAFGTSPEQVFQTAIDELFKPESLPETLVSCLTEDRLIVAGSVDTVKAILRREKSSRTLADSDDHKALLRHLKPIGTVRFLVSVPRLLDLAKAEAEGDEAEDMAKWMKVLGAEGLRSAVGHMRLGASSYDSKFELLFLMSGERSGLAKLLSMENRPIAPPTAVSTDALFFATLNLSVPKMVDEIESMVRQVDPNEADQMRAGMEAVPLPGSPEPVNIRTELLDHLVGPVCMSLTATKPLGPGAVRPLLTIGHKDQAAVARFMGKLAGMMLQPPRDVRGTQVFDSMMPPGMSLAAVNDRVLIGTAPAVESAMEAGKGEALAETEGWRRAARQVPDQAWLTMYFDQRQAFAAALELAKKKDEASDGPAFDIGGMMLSGLLGGATEEMGEKEQKQARKVIKYMQAGVLTVSTMPEGVRVTAVSLKPAEE